MTQWIEEYIKRTCARLVTTINFECEVVSVDKVKDTIVVKPTEGDDIPDVKLKSVISNSTQKIVAYPAVGSFVTVSSLRNTMIDYYVSQYSEVEELKMNCDNIVINDGSKGGLVNWPDVKAELDKTNEVVNILKNLLTTWVPAPGDGGAALKTAATAQLAGKVTGNFNDKEDTKVKH